MYSIFDLISPTFHRLSYTSIRNRSLTTSSAILYPLTRLIDETSSSSCSYQSYDDICIIQSETNTSLINFPQPILSSTNLIKSVQTSTTFTTLRVTSSRKSSFSTSLISISENNSLSMFNETSISTQSKKPIPWLTISLYSFAISFGTLLCILFSICIWIKYRRKDAGVYEVEEAQRFRPLIVQLSPTSGETTSISRNAIEISSKNKINKNKSKQKRKKSSNSTVDEQREFYI